MRGWRAFAVLTGVLLLLGGASYGLYRIVLTTSRYSSTPLSPQIGQALFAGLVFLELLMVCFITPAVTAGTISGEREKQTYEMLLATPLRPGSVLRGKLLSALSYVLLLILAAIPMASLVFIFGGVAPKELVKGLICIVCTAVMLGVVGVFMSAWLGRTTRATVLSYLFVLVLLIGPAIAYLLTSIIQEREAPRWILVPNPVSALASAIAPSASTQGPVGFLGSLGWFLSGGFSIARSGLPMRGVPRPLYQYTLALYGGVSVLLYLLSLRLVRPQYRWRIRWREALGGLALLLAFGGFLGGFFWLTGNRYIKVSALATPTPMMIPQPVRMQPVVVEREVVRVVEVTPVPTPTPTPLPPPSTSGETAQTPDEDDTVAIYAAVVRQLYTVDHTFGEPPNFPAIYMLSATDDRVGDPNAPRTESVELPESTRSLLVDVLVASGLPAEFLWVDDRAEVPMDDHGAVQGGGAMIILGNVHPQQDGSVLVSAKLYFAQLGAGARTYVLEVLDGFWQVTGDTGVVIIS
jgi:ABC-type transport system involved in multi-copper enzyme maturation permease subunit